MAVYFVELNPPYKLFGTKCFAALKFCDSAFVALACWISRYLEPSVPRLLLTHTMWCWRTYYFIRLVVLPQYNEDNDETMELSSLSAPFLLPTPLPSPTQIWLMGIALVVDAPPLPVVEICSIFEDDLISMIAIELLSTPNRNVWAADNKKSSNYLTTDEKLLDNVDPPEELGTNR